MDLRQRNGTVKGPERPSATVSALDGELPGDAPRSCGRVRPDGTGGTTELTTVGVVLGDCPRSPLSSVRKGAQGGYPEPVR